MTPILVIGGGLAGAAMATHLARAGREVLLLEREAGAHDKVCGEFLSYEAQGDLRDLGVDLPALGAVPIETVAVLHRRRGTQASLAFTALSLSRRVLDEALLDRAAAAGVQVRRGVRVTTLERAAKGWRATTSDGEALDAAEAVLATGKHDLRGWRRPAGAQPDLLGFKAYWRLAPRQAQALDRRVELHLFAGGYAGLEAVEGDRANLCLVVRKPVFAELGGRWEDLLARLLDACPALAERLAAATLLTPRPLAIAAIPYGHVRARSDGPWRLGDQAAVIPSFTGEGMSIALHSARLAARFMLEGRTAAAFQPRLARDVGRQVRRATALSQVLVRPAVQALIAHALPRPLLTLAVRETRISPSARAAMM